MTSIIALTPQQLRRAADIKDQLASLQLQLSRILGSSAPSANGTPAGKKRKMSAAGRARIVAAQKARWAKQKGAKSGKTAVKRKRNMSAATRKHLAQLAKARWAKARAAGKKTL